MRRGGAFTLIELLVVIAILALLVSILLPSLKQAKALARRVLCMTRMRTMHTGMVFYAEANDGTLCPASHRYDEGIEWQGEVRYGLWVMWNSQPLIGQYFGNEAITCSAIWPPPNAVSEVIYCTELSYAEMSRPPEWGPERGVYKGMPWRTGIGMNCSYFGPRFPDGRANRYIPLPTLEKPHSFGLLGCSHNGYMPDAAWEHVTTDVDGVALDKGYRDRSNRPHNMYRHVETTNIAFAGGHVIFTDDAAEMARQGELVLDE